MPTHSLSFSLCQRHPHSGSQHQVGYFVHSYQKRSLVLRCPPPPPLSPQKKDKKSRHRDSFKRLFFVTPKIPTKNGVSVGLLVCLSWRFTSSGCWKTLSWRLAYNLEDEEKVCAAIGARQVIGHAARPSLYSGNARLEEQGTSWFSHIFFLRRLSPFILFPVVVCT